MKDLLELLVGEWRGEGFGQYPTIKSFEYQEILRFKMDETRPALQYEQKTWRHDLEKGELVPSHWETGFLYWLEGDQIELINAQFGDRAEVMRGTIEETPAGLALRFRSSRFANDPRMEGATRTFTVEGDTLHYSMHMQTTNVPHLTLHLEATLQK